MSMSTKITHSSLFHQYSTPFLKPTKLSSLFKKFFSNNINTINEDISTKEADDATPPPSQSAVELPPKLQEIIKLFQALEEPKAKLEQLLFYGKKLNSLELKYKTSENKVPSCVSQVWVRAYLDDDKKFVFEADSDSLLTKGLAALLVQSLSGRPIDEITRVSPDIVMLLGCRKSITPSRSNGFLNMLKLMQHKALMLHASEKTSFEDSNYLVKNVNGEVS